MAAAIHTGISVSDFCFTGFGGLLAPRFCFGFDDLLLKKFEVNLMACSEQYMVELVEVMDCL